MKSGISQPHIKQFIDLDLAESIDESLSQQFSEKPEKMGWLGSGLDWSGVPNHIIFSIDDHNEDQIYTELMNTTLGDAEEVFVLYGSEQKGLKCSLDVFAKNRGG